MAGIKRSHDGKRSNGIDSSSPFMSMFETFRNELDEHHDRRERIIKASRDITAMSKKMIFSLQRIRQLNQEIPTPVLAENSERSSKIASLFCSLSPDLQNLKSWRYQRQISGGIQEFMEAVSFQHYLETQRLITYEEASYSIPGGVQLTEDDYVLGIFDLVGELMRFAITAMATSGYLPGDVPDTDTHTGAESGIPSGKATILTDLRSLRTYFESLDTTSGTGGGSALGRDVEKKMGVMKTCVEKVENSVYGMIIRGRERPKGWIPDLADDGEIRREPVESY
ncbi:MAG: hypothetical protein M1827_007194 [Pycnora praestabilis]|nr:MAG: hypothetical protein M1827_007194 [Pycnora praestabilis]